MSWFTNALDLSQKVINSTDDGVALIYMKAVRNIFLEEYVKEAESIYPKFANYANPNDLK